MKAEILEQLAQFESDLRRFRTNVKANTAKQVSSVALRKEAERLADCWVEKLRSPLEHKFHISAEVIESTSDAMKRLHVLSRPNNLKTSYLAVLDLVLEKFKDKFCLPIQQTSTAVESVFDLEKLVAGLSNPDESDYLKEAIDCANANFRRAAIVLGWCAAISHIQKKIQAAGFAAFNSASTSLKGQTSGRFKRWNKEFNVASLAELQEVFDTDLITVCEGLGWLDSNQADRLKAVDFQWRNHSAHPGEAPIGDPHLVAFFTDINSIVLTNPNFAVK